MVVEIGSVTTEEEEAWAKRTYGSGIKGAVEAGQRLGGGDEGGISAREIERRRAAEIASSEEAARKAEELRKTQEARRIESERRTALNKLTEKYSGREALQMSRQERLKQFMLERERIEGLTRVKRTAAGVETGGQVLVGGVATTLTQEKAKEMLREPKPPTVPVLHPTEERGWVSKFKKYVKDIITPYPAFTTPIIQSLPKPTPTNLLGFKKEVIEKIPRGIYQPIITREEAAEVLRRGGQIIHTPKGIRVKPLGVLWSDIKKIPPAI